MYLEVWGTRERKVVVVVELEISRGRVGAVSKIAQTFGIARLETFALCSGTEIVNSSFGASSSKGDLFVHFFVTV